VLLPLDLPEVAEAAGVDADFADDEAVAGVLVLPDCPTNAGSCPVTRPCPVAVEGRTRYQPGSTAAALPKVFPPGSLRPLLRLKSSDPKLLLPRNLWAISERYSGLPSWPFVTT